MAFFVKNDSITAQVKTLYFVIPVLRARKSLTVSVIPAQAPIRTREVSATYKVLLFTQHLSVCL